MKRENLIDVRVSISVYPPVVETVLGCSSSGLVIIISQLLIRFRSSGLVMQSKSNEINYYYYKDHLSGTGIQSPRSNEEPKERKKETNKQTRAFSVARVPP